MRELLMGRLGELRYEPIDKRIRAAVDERTVIDTTRALLVWEPKRIVPSYAVPVEDIGGVLVGGSAPRAGSNEAFLEPQLAGRPVYDPSVPFSVHTADGEAMDLRADGTVLAGAAFRPADEALSDYAILDFRAFDAWYEEDELNVGHPRDPFHRIDIVHSSRHVQVQHGAVVLADSTSPYLLFEPPLPVRYYFAREDLTPGLLRPSETRTFCAYKGKASYLSLADEEDIAWTYPEPLREAVEVTDRIAFFNERVDVIVDGQQAERPITPWSRRP